MTFDLLLAFLLQSSLVLAVSGLATAVLGRAAAAWRHAVWSAAFILLLLLPAGLLVPPMPLPPVLGGVARLTEPGVAAVYSLEVVGQGRSASSWFAPLWLLGAVALCCRLAWAFVRTAGVAARAEAWPEQGDDVRLSGEMRAPFAFGLLTPVVVLPAGAAAWREERLRIVLLHERAHLARHDTRLLFLAQLVSALYWMNPLVWLGLRQLRMESERACDDAVLLTGEEAPVYASHLVEIARSVQINRSVPEGGIAMVQLSQMERRLTALLDPAVTRATVGRGGLAVLGVLAVALLVPLSAVRAPAQARAKAESSGLAGRVSDQAGAPVRGAVVKASRGDGSGALEAALSKADGTFSVAPLAAGPWNVSVAKEGFATVRMEGVQVGGAGLSALDIRLAAADPSVAAMREMAPPATASPLNSPGMPKRITVAAQAARLQLISRQAPVYPLDCKAEGVEGPVVLRVVISREGLPLTIDPLNRLADARLVAAAVEAVRTWRWRPTLLNGNPVEVRADIDINFRLDP